MWETLLLKYGIPLIIELLQKWGFFDAAQAIAAKTADDILVDIKSTKTYQEFPAADTQHNFNRQPS